MATAIEEPKTAGDHQATIDAFNAKAKEELKPGPAQIRPSEIEVIEPEIRMLWHSDELGELAEALSKCQGQMKPAIADKVGVHNAKYADLSSTWEVIRKPMSDNGLSITQFPTPCGKGSKAVNVTTFLLHKSGQYMAHTLSMPLAKTDAQGVGSGITYAQRYSMRAILGVPSEDDDGEAASGLKK